MRASYFTDFRATEQLPVVDFDPAMDLTFKDRGYVGLQYVTEQHPENPELRRTETFTAVIDLDVLYHVRASLGRIWALKYVRSCTVTVDSPYGCSLLVAKNFVDEFCPIDYFRADDEAREIKAKLWADYQRRLDRDPDPRD